MGYEMDDETKERLAAIHSEIRDHGRAGNAVALTPGDYPSYVYWDEQTEQWLVGSYLRNEGGWHLFGADEFPQGWEIIYGWDEYEVVPVEETKLHHAAYGLDQARDGYGELMQG